MTKPPSRRDLRTSRKAIDPYEAVFNMCYDLFNRTVEQLSGISGLMRSDTYETDREWVYMVEIPGLTRDHEIDVRTQGQYLSIHGGSRDKLVSHSGVTQYKSELSFSYVVPIPDGVDASRMTTQLSDEVLTVRIPKKTRKSVKVWDV